MSWFRKRDKTDRVDPDAAIRQAQEVKRQVIRQQPFVNHLVNYAEDRVGRNGFGEDVEMTFRPKTQGT